ncbi:MAG: hypothetical protein ACI4TX_03745 [Christensenellales bacterium]
MKHFLIIGFICLFCFGVLPQFFINTDDGVGNSKEMIVNLEKEESKDNNINNGNSVLMPDKNEVQNTESTISANAKPKLINEDEKETQTDCTDCDNDKQIKEYIVHDSDLKETKNVKLNDNNIKSKNKENEEINSQLKDKNKEKNLNANAKGNNASENNSKNDATDKVSVSKKDNSIKEDKKSKQEDKRAKKDARINERRNIKHKNNDNASVSSDNSINALNVIEDEEKPENREIKIRTWLKKADDIEINNDSNESIDEKNKSEQNENINTANVATNELPIEEKMISEHKQERAKKEVPGTNKMDNANNLNTLEEAQENIEEVELLGIIDNATVVMQDGIVNVKVGV